jgi:large subunit ribosomal protein L4
MKLKVYREGKLAEREFDTRAFGEKVLYKTLKDALVSYQANQRQGTASTRTRGEVAGSGKKPWKQKHTGRARAGDRKSPIWRGGGTVFGPKPRDYSYHMPAKARRVALRSALAGKLRDGEVVIFERSGFAEPSAKAARAVLAGVGALESKQGSRALVVLAEHDANVWRSFRNFPRVSVRTASDLCAYDVVAGGLVLAEPAALDALAARVGLAATPEATPEAATSPGGGER